MSPTGRMLELLSLLQNGEGWTGAELATRLGTSARTVRRDIDRLRELGYPVEAARGTGGSYRLVAGAAMPPLSLTDDEAAATVLGLRFAAALSHVDSWTAAESALHKLDLVMPSRVRVRLAGVLASAEFAGRSGPAPDLSVVQALGSAVTAHQDVRFEYRTRHGQQSNRRVEPYRQVLLGRGWYLLGWDRDRAAWRTFRLDRVSSVQVPGTTFAPRPLPEEGAVSFVQRSARVPITRHHGVVRFSAPVSVVAERLTVEAGTLEALGEEECRYVTPADSWEWLAITLALVGVPYRIEGPPELVEFSRELAGRIAAAADAAPG